MHTSFGKLASVLLALGTLSTTAVAQSDPRAVTAVRAAVNSQMAADRTDRSNWIYTHHDTTEDHDDISLCVGSPQGEMCRTLKHHGVPLSAAEQQSESNRLSEYVHDTSAQAKNRKNQAHDDAQATQLLKMLPDGFIWTITSDTPEFLTLAYRPNPQFDPPNMQARVFSAMAGTLVIVKNGDLIRSFTGSLTEDVKIGFGILGRLTKGGRIDIERRDVGSNHWEITEEHVHIGGHALFFKSIGTQQDDVKTNWRPSPAQNLQDVEEQLRNAR